MKFLFAFFVALNTTPVFADSYIVHGTSRYDHHFSLVSITRDLPLSGIQIAELTPRQAAQLRQAGIEVEKNREIRIAPLTAAGVVPGTPTDFRALIHAAQANALPGGSGEGITICLVDTGIDVRLPDLKGAVVGGVNLQDPTNPDFPDDLGHGTGLASVIAGRGVFAVAGVAPKVSIYAVKVGDATGATTTALLAEGIRSCIGHAQIVNISMGSFTDSNVIQAAVDDVVRAQLTVFGASGNEAEDIMFPARYGLVSAVGAVTADLHIADFSGRGPALDYVAPGKYIQVLLPGGGTALRDGTSYSSAITAGIEAIRLSRGRPKILTRDLGFTSSDQGQGLVDAF